MADKEVGKFVCWCGRLWVVASLKRQCEAGGHLPFPPEASTR